MNDDEKKVREELKELAARAVPHKKHKKGTHKGFGTVTDPKVGAATAIKPGEVRNPGGRPKNSPITEALRERLMSRFPLEFANALGIPENSTWADAVACTALLDLVKRPNAENFEKYAQIVEGRPKRDENLHAKQIKPDGQKRRRANKTPEGFRTSLLRFSAPEVQ